MTNVVSLRDDPLSLVYQAAEDVTREDLELGGEKARILNSSILRCLDRGIVPLSAIFLYLSGGNDPAHIYRGLSRRLDDYENRGFPPLVVVAAEYLGQLQIDPVGSEGAPLVSLCAAVDRLAAMVPSLDLRSLHEALHLSFITVCSLPNHQGINSDSDLVSKVASSVLIGNLKGFRRAITELSRNNALVIDGLLRIRALEAGCNRSELQDAYNNLLQDGDSPDDGLPLSDRVEILCRALVVDVLEMQASQYLHGGSYLVSNPVTVCGELLTPASTMEFLRDFMDNADVIEDVLDADNVSRGGLPGH